MFRLPWKRASKDGVKPCTLVPNGGYGPVGGAMEMVHPSSLWHEWDIAVHLPKVQQADGSLHSIGITPSYLGSFWILRSLETLLWEEAQYGKGGTADRFEVAPWVLLHPVLVRCLESWSKREREGILPGLVGGVSERECSPTVGSVSDVAWEVAEKQPVMHLENFGVQLV